VSRRCCRWPARWWLQRRNDHRRALLPALALADAVEILPGWVGSADLRVLTLELEVDEPELLLDFVEARIR